MNFPSFNDKALSAANFIKKYCDRTKCLECIFYDVKDNSCTLKKSPNLWKIKAPKESEFNY